MIDEALAQEYEVLKRHVLQLLDSAMRDAKALCSTGCIANMEEATEISKRMAELERLMRIAHHNELEQQRLALHEPPVPQAIENRPDMEVAG